jgi:hypothetical protein
VTFIVPNLGYLDAVLPPRLETDVVWHYTDAAGVLGIIQDGAIRASAIWAMNDRAEFTYGVDFIRAEWERRKDEFERHDDVTPLLLYAFGQLHRANSFVACASRKENSLGQWRSYGGYAIGINTGMQLQVRTGEHAPPSAAVWTEELGAAQLAAETGWRDVVYQPDAQRNMVGRLFAELDRLAPEYKADWSDESSNAYRQCMTLVAHTVPYLKHPAFEDEHEVRFFVDYETGARGVKLRVGRLGITSYLELESRQALLAEVEKHSPAPYRPRLFPITKVQLGPGVGDREVARQGVEVALQIHGFDKTVEMVDSPLR